MTILTKPNCGAKSNPKDLNPVHVESGANTEQDENGNNDQLLLIRERARRFTGFTLLLILAAMCLALMGLLIGLVVYRRVQLERMREMHFRGNCNLPYDGVFDDKNVDMLTALNKEIKDFETYTAERLRSQFGEQNDVAIFREEFDLDLTDENAVAKITVPDFRNGRVGRFLHDFKSNQTAIIDESARRCFVMPLDRDEVLPPKSLADVILKMYMGYYDVNTSSVRKNMRVVTPALDDLSSVSNNIQMACDSMSIYRLEKVVGGVVKRSADAKSDYMEFSGSFIHYNLEGMENLN